MFSSLSSSELCKLASFRSATIAIHSGHPRVHVAHIMHRTPIESGYPASAVTTHHTKQESHRITRTWTPRHCEILHATSPLTLRPQTAQCLRPEETFQPLVTGIVTLPPWHPQHFDGLRSRQELLFFSASRSHFHLFFRSSTSQVVCPRSLRAFGSPVLIYAPLDSRNEELFPFATLLSHDSMGKRALELTPEVSKQGPMDKAVISKMLDRSPQ